MARKLKKQYLLSKIPSILKDDPRGLVLDLGCGRGLFAQELHNLGFDVIAADFDPEHFECHEKIKFQQCNLLERLPFNDSTFDYLLFIETIEHLEKPFEVVGELSRVLKPGGKLIISTPNILNIGSRLRFLFEGSLDFFREPILDFQEHYIGTIENMHIIPWRYHELEYMLFRQGFNVEGIYTDRIHSSQKPLFYLLYPIMWFQRKLKEKRSIKRGGMNFKRINNILFMPELLFGKHLIVKAVNNKQKGQPFGQFIKKEEIKKFDPAGEVQRLN